MRHFFKAFIVCFVLSVIACPSMFAEQGSILFTESMAVAEAEKFANSMCPDKSLSAGTPVKMYDASGQAIGYVLDYRNPSGEASGYIVFDNTDETLIAEYSFDEGVKGPYDIAEDVSVSQQSRSIDDGKRFCKVDAFSYEIRDAGVSERDSGAVEGTEAFSSGTTNSWDEIFLGKVGDNRYTISEMRTIPQFIAITEDQAKTSGRYACGASAMLHAAIHYSPAGIDWEHPGEHYRSLWTLSKTSTVGYEGSIALGDTLYINLGPALQHFLAYRGVYTGYTGGYNPKYSSFRSTINSNDIALFCCGVNMKSGRVGHIMTVEGYATLKNSSGKSFNALVVADGWNAYARYLNYSYANYTDTYGVFYYKSI